MIRFVLGLVFVLGLTLLGVRGDTAMPSADSIVASHETRDDDVSTGSFGSSSEEEDDDDAPPVAIEGREVPSHPLFPAESRAIHAPTHDVMQALVAPPEPPPPRG